MNPLFKGAPAAEIYSAQRHPQWGSRNPDEMSFPFWLWMVESETSPYEAAEHYGAPSAMEAGAGWTFMRMGMSETRLPDGRVVFIAGEHEDHYDPDFYIYNDVIVKHPDGRIQIFGYPKNAFRPTDFHTASLVDDEIYIVGSLGYPDDRRDGITSIYGLDTRTFAIREVTAAGEGPGWLHHHTASYDSKLNAITVFGGDVWNSGREPQYIENINDYRLHLSDLRWEQLTDRNWQRFEFFRPDGEGLGLTDEPKWQKHLEETQARLLEGLGADPSPEMLESIQRVMEQRDALDLVWPDIDHERITQPQPQSTDDDAADDDSFNNDYKTRRIRVGDVIVRYVQEFNTWIMVVEGALDEGTESALVEDLKRKLAKHFEAEIQLRRIGD